MIRLPGRLPEFTRVGWVSKTAQDAWAPRIQRIERAFLDVERRALSSGLREAALQYVTPKELVEIAAWAVERELVLTPVSVAGDRLRIALTRTTATARAFLRSWTSGDDATVGLMLGYPDCCRDFFLRVWKREGFRDTTYLMAEAGTEGPPEANILLRWLGVRMVPHLPCSFHCDGTVALAHKLEELAAESGYAEEWGWIREMLSWPTEWTALHGIAEITNPVLRISADTDLTGDRLSVRKEGTRYPDEGANGLRFPFRERALVRLTSGRSFRAGATHAAKRDDYLWTDNGFSSVKAMVEAHEVIAGLVDGMEWTGAAVDLGAGNGALLQRIAQGRSVSTKLIGVELDPARASRPAPGFGFNLTVEPGDMFDYDVSGAGLVILMPGRLLEVIPWKAQRLRERLKTVPWILAYAYGDWMRKEGSLGQLCFRAGLVDDVACGNIPHSTIVKTADGPGVAAMLLRNPGGEHG